MNPIEIIFKGRNETKQAVEGVKDGLDEVKQSASGANESLAETNAILGSGAMLDFKNAAVDAFNAAAGAAMEFVSAASDAELVGVRMEATIKALGDRAPTTAKQINELADELSGLTGYDDEELVSAQATLARIGSVSEENFDRATRAAVDLAAATGMELEAAFQAVGVAMEKADFGRLERQIGELPPEMQEAAKAALEMGDAVKAQEIILTGIEQKVGGAGEAIGETFAGEMNKLQVEYGNFQESVGTPLLKLFVDLPDPVKSAGFAIYSLGQTFGPVVSSVADLAIATRGLNAAMGAQGLTGALKGVQVAGATSFGPLLLNLGLVAIAVAAVVAVWDQWNKQIVQTNEKGAEAVKGQWEKFFDEQIKSGKSAAEIIDEYNKAQASTRQVLEDTNPVVRAFIFNKDELTKSDKALEAALRQVTDSETEFQSAMEYASRSAAQMADETKVAAEETQTAGAMFGDEFGSQIAAGFAQGLLSASTASQQLITLAGVTVEQMLNAAAAGLAQMLLTASQSAQMIVAALSAAWQQMWRDVQEWFGRIVERVSSWGERIKSEFNRIAQRAADWGRSIVEGLWQGIQNGWEWLKTMIRTNIDNLLAWVKDLLGIGSPSKLFADQVGRPIAQGIVQGFDIGMRTAGPHMGAALQPAAISPISASPTYGGGMTVNVTGGFYSPVTHAERARIRREQESAAISLLSKVLKR